MLTAQITFNAVICLILGIMLVRIKGRKLWSKARRLMGWGLVGYCVCTSIVFPTTRKVVRTVEHSVGEAWESVSIIPDTAIEYASPQEIRAMIAREANRQGVPVEVALAFAEIESNYTNAIGDGGRSFGPLQVQAQYHIKGCDPELLDCSIPAGISVIKRKLATYGGDVEKARIAYVCGSLHSCSPGKTLKVQAKIRPYL